jgi:hypothetical protein
MKGLVKTLVFLSITNAFAGDNCRLQRAYSTCGEYGANYNLLCDNTPKYRVNADPDLEVYCQNDDYTITIAECFDRTDPGYGVTIKEFSKTIPVYVLGNQTVFESCDRMEAIKIK